LKITAERAFWLLDYYRRHGKVLVFGGRILGEDAGCEAQISYVWPETHSIGMKLLSEDRKQSWDRIAPLARAEFHLFQLGDDEFEAFGNTQFHSVLMLVFQDGTTMFLAEQAPTIIVKQ
jgi:hypothetical protein